MKSFTSATYMGAGHQDTVSTVAFSFDGQLLATGGFDGLIHVWDASSGSLKCTLEGSGDGFEVSCLFIGFCKAFFVS